MEPANVERVQKFAHDAARRAKLVQSECSPEEVYAEFEQAFERAILIGVGFAAILQEQGFDLSNLKSVDGLMEEASEAES